MGVAYDKRDRHGFTERPAEGQHHAADDADAGERQHDISPDFPLGPAEPIGSFFQDRRNRIEHVS